MICRNALIFILTLVTSFPAIADPPQSGHIVVDSGSVTCNAGTNLNTSLLATAAKQDTGNTSVASIDTKTPALGQATMANSSPVVLASNQSAIPVSGTFYQATQPVSIASGQVASGAIAAGAVASGAIASGAVASGAIASGAFASGSVSDAAIVTLGAKADAKSSATDTTAITAMQVFKEISFLLQNALAVSQSGTWTVQPGNTPNSSPWLFSIVPATSGGWSVHHAVSANTTNATNIKASAGQVGGWYIYNHTTSMRKLAFHNTAGTPTAGASIYFTLNLPAGPTAANVLGDAGIAFSTGIAYTTVTDVTDAGTTAVGTSDLTINIFYK